MINIKVDTSGLVRLQAEMAGQGKQARFAAMQALNQAAYQAAQATSKEIAKVFDKPTPWVLKSVRYLKARRDRLEAQVDFDFWGNKQGVTVSSVLRAEIHGGVRKSKRHEIALQRAGILPAGMGIVPSTAAKLDAYGNISSGQIVQIMSWFQSFGEQGYSANMKDKGKKRLGRDSKRTGQKGFSYFALQKRRGKLLPGVYQRFEFGSGSAVKPVMIFVRMPKYRARLDFYGLASRVAIAEYNARLPALLDQAIRTAK